MDRTDILSSLAGRNRRWGIRTASDYVNSFAGCLGDGFCPTSLMGVSGEQWAKCLKEAAQTLTFANQSMQIKDLSESDLPDGAIMVYDGVMTSTRRDRDFDILETSGARIDPKHPALWQHLALQPTGPFIKEVGRTKNMVIGRFAIADTPLGRDAAALVRLKALRLSIGFQPEEFEPIEDEKGEQTGWRIRKFEVMETSLVSVPSNVSAEILSSVSKSKSFAQELDGIRTAYGRDLLKTDLVKRWAKHIHDNRPTQVAVQRQLLETGAVSDKSGDLWATYSAKPCSCQTDKAHGLPRPTQQQTGDEKPERWNRKLSKSFDVALEYLQPTKLEYDWVSRYLNCEIKHIFQNSTIVPTARIGSWLTGLRHVTADSQVDDVRNIEGDKERPPEYEVIQLNSKQSDDFLIDGISFHKEGRTKYVLNVSPCYAGLYVILYTSVDDKSKNREILDKTWQWAVENNFLKGEAFSLAGEFLPRAGQGFEDVFLPEKNEKPLRRCVDLINAKGKSAANRGMILMGPPGTGKTLSGRILKDQANATFIWMSSRDFYYMGAFGGFAYGFELARELAPAILFIEDVDNWLTERTLDLLKTEMDGIGRSTGITTILTTNYPERLPEALIDRPGRFHDVLKFDLPTANERKRMLSKWIDGISPSELTQAVAKTDGYSGAHLYELANFAKTLKEEEECSLATALTKALEKIAEQRELINDSQLAGSNYRPRKSVEQKSLLTIDDIMGRKEAKSQCTCPECGHRGPMSDFTGDDYDEDGKSARIERLYLARLMKDLGRARMVRDSLTNVLEAHQSPRENAVDSGLQLLGFTTSVP